MKKLLSIILTATMLVGMLTFGAVAEDPDMALKFNDITVKGAGGDLGMANLSSAAITNAGFTVAMDFVYGRSGVCYHPVDTTMKHTSKFAFYLGHSEGTGKYVGYSATEEAFFVGLCANSPVYGEGADGIDYLALSEKGLILPGVEYNVVYEFIGDTGINIYVDGVEVLSFDLYEDMDYPTYFPYSGYAMLYPTHMTCFVDNVAVYAPNVYDATTGEASADPAAFNNFDSDAEMKEVEIKDADGNVIGTEELVSAPNWQIVKSAYSLVDPVDDIYAQPQYVPAEDEANIIFQSGLDRKANGADETFASGREFDIDLTIKNNAGINSITLDLLSDAYITPVSVAAADGLTATLDGTKLTITGDNYTGEALATITYNMDAAAVQDFSYSYGANTTTAVIEGAVTDAVITNGSSVVYNFTVGDVNDDGNFNLNDVTDVLKFIAKWDMGDKFRDSCDVNGDGRINSMDASYYLRWIAGWYYDYTINGITHYPPR